MEVAVGIAVGTCFSAWFAISVIAQLHQRAHMWVPLLESFALIPYWTFFAPRPSTHDVHLLYRDRRADGSVSELYFVPTLERRRWYHVIWNPEKFRNKVVADVLVGVGLNVIETERQDVDLHYVMLTTPYLMGLHLVMQRPRTDGAVARQFVLARNRSFVDEPDAHIVFWSPFHPFVTAQPEALAA